MMAAQGSVAPKPAKPTVAGWKTFTTEDGLLGQDCRFVHFGRDGGLYAGFHSGEFYQKKFWALNYYDGQWNRLQPKVEYGAWHNCMAQCGDGAIWLGGSQTLWHLRGEEARFFITKEIRRRGGRYGRPVLEPHPEANSDIPGGTIYALLADVNHNVWLGSDRGVSRYDGREASWRHFSTRDGLPGQEVFALAQDRAGVIWAGTSDGIARFEKDRWSAARSCGNDLVLAAAAAPDGTVWFGTYRNGVVAVRDGHFESWHSANSRLRHNLAPVLTCDSKGRLWLANADGLICFDGKDWRVYDLSNSGLPSKQINSLAVDDSNHLWIATNAGVARFDMP